VTPPLAPNSLPPTADAAKELVLNSRPPEPIPNERTVLSPEEQMARFEDDLKENDWGHQPC